MTFKLNNADAMDFSPKSEDGLCVKLLFRLFGSLPIIA